LYFAALPMLAQTTIPAGVPLRVQVDDRKREALDAIHHPNDALEDIDAEHPPDKKQRNDGEYDVGDPLEGCFGLAELEHSGILAW